ncbi:hypothetical protein, partial [Cupriavidus sp. UYPR2.512]|uniref:hypothetical protein n=1 Tax=Cupriavidus sp. UYPR2.512 TaxID=1080187 RepID=UPI001E409CF9
CNCARSSSLNTSSAFGLPVLIVVSPFPNAETVCKTNASYLWDGTLALRETSLTAYPAHTLYGQGKTRGQICELLEPAAINQACAAIVLVNGDAPQRKYVKLSSRKSTTRFAN